MDDREHTDESDATVAEEESTTEVEERAESETEASPLTDGEEHRVDPRTVLVGRISAASVLLPIAMAQLLFLTIGWASGGIPGAVSLSLFVAWLVLFAMFVLLAFHWPALRYRHLRYLVEDDGLRIHRGVFWRKVIWIPITRVQHTDVSQGPVQRWLGLGTLTVHTAGTAGASISLPGLEHDIASRLSEHLRPAPNDAG